MEDGVDGAELKELGDVEDHGTDDNTDHIVPGRKRRNTIAGLLLGSFVQGVSRSSGRRTFYR